MPAAWVERLADAFWERVGARPAPPRDVEPFVPLVADVLVRAAPGLRPTTVVGWLRRQGVPVPGETEDRPLLGCVVAYRGRGAVFVDDALPADERRVIAAHEFAHFLAEYDRPRERVVRRLGRGVLPVLDGDRPPTAADGWAAALAGVSLGTHAHYLSRAFDPAGLEAVEHVERTANELALELLAPWREVSAGFPPTDAPPAVTIEAVLVSTFGLPPRWAGPYARTLAAAAGRRRPASRAFGL